MQIAFRRQSTSARPSVVQAAPGGPVRALLLGVVAVGLMASVGLFAGAASAGNFTVQIGAFRDAPSGFASAASEIGDLRTTRTDGGITRYRIGDFDTLTAAEAARTRLIGAGYRDAYVVQTRRSPGSPRVTAAAAPAPSPRPASTARDPLAGVPASIRSQVVLLDGRYHVKEGDRFIQLEQYLRENGLR